MRRLAPATRNRPAKGITFEGRRPGAAASQPRRSENLPQPNLQPEIRHHGEGDPGGFADLALQDQPHRPSQRKGTTVSLASIARASSSAAGAIRRSSWGPAIARAIATRSSASGSERSSRTPRITPSHNPKRRPPSGCRRAAARSSPDRKHKRGQAKEVDPDQRPGDRRGVSQGEESGQQRIEDVLIAVGRNVEMRSYVLRVRIERDVIVELPVVPLRAGGIGNAESRSDAGKNQRVVTVGGQNTARDTPPRAR